MTIEDIKAIILGLFTAFAMLTAIILIVSVSDMGRYKLFGISTTGMLGFSSFSSILYRIEKVHSLGLSLLIITTMFFFLFSLMELIKVGLEKREADLKQKRKKEKNKNINK